MAKKGKGNKRRADEASTNPPLPDNAAKKASKTTKGGTVGDRPKIKKEKASSTPVAQITEPPVTPLPPSLTLMPLAKSPGGVKNCSVICPN